MKNKIKLTILAIAMLFGFSCTDLEEVVLDESLSGTVSEDEIITSCGCTCLCKSSNDYFYIHIYFAFR